MTKIQIPWECVYNHLPDWVIEYENEIDAFLIDKEENNPDYNIIIGLMDTYNNLTDFEKDNTDAHSLYGIEDEKQELIDEMVKIFSKYEERAKELRKSCKL